MFGWCQNEAFLTKMRQYMEWNVTLVNIKNRRGQVAQNTSGFIWDGLKNRKFFLHCTLSQAMHNHKEPGHMLIVFLDFIFVSITKKHKGRVPCLAILSSLTLSFILFLLSVHKLWICTVFIEYKVCFLFCFLPFHTYMLAQKTKNKLEFQMWNSKCVFGIQ